MVILEKGVVHGIGVLVCKMFAYLGGPIGYKFILNFGSTVNSICNRAHFNVVTTVRY